jgi:hypothetical protein
MLLPHTSEWVSHPHGDRVSQELSPFPSVPLSLVGKFRMNESHVLTELMWRLLIIAAVTVAITHYVLSVGIGLGRHARCAIGQQLDIAVERQGNRLVDTVVALRQLGSRLAVTRPLYFNMTLPLLRSLLSEIVALFPSAISAVYRVVSCPAP